MKEENHDHHDVIDSFYFGKLSLKDLISMTHEENILYKCNFVNLEELK